jgi:hypothetical protein
VYQNWREVENLIQAFENCTLLRHQWTHSAHLTIAWWYFIHNSEPDAIAKIRHGIQRYNTAVGIPTTSDSGYHETLTLFWAAMIRQHIGCQQVAIADDDSIRLAKVNGLIQAYGDPQLPFAYYSRKQLLSWEARMGWIEPDLQPLRM